MARVNDFRWKHVIDTLGLRPLVIETNEVTGSQQAGMSGATIVRIETSTGVYCLRGWPRNALPYNRIVGLHRLLAHLSAQGLRGVAVPLPLALRTSELPRRHAAGVSSSALQRFSPLHDRSSPTLYNFDDRYWQLEPWLPGHADFNSRPSLARLTSIMHELARWHRASRTFFASSDVSEWFFNSPQHISPAIVERNQLLNNWINEKKSLLQHSMQQDRQQSGEWDDVARTWKNAFQIVAPLIHHELQSALRWRVAVQPCLRDIHHDHVLLTGDQVTGIIDPSAARSENVASDLSRLLGSLTLDEPCTWKVAMEAYQEINPLSDIEICLVRILHRSGILLSGLNWLERVYLNNSILQSNDSVLERMRWLTKQLQGLL